VVRAADRRPGATQAALDALRPWQRLACRHGDWQAGAE